MALSRARQVLAHWRHLNASLQDAGSPRCPVRLTISRDSLMSQACFSPDRRAVIVPYWEPPLTGLDLTAAQAHAAPVFVLLHEQAHARLYGQDGAWLSALPSEHRLYVDPVWEQVPGHPGWMTFNELYADISAAVWSLRLSQGDGVVRSLVESLARYRHVRTWQDMERGVPHFHATSDALLDVLAQAWWGKSDAEERIRGLALLHFSGWLEGGGRDWCGQFVEQRLFDPPLVAGLLSSPSPPFRPQPRLHSAMVDLAQAIPDHPIFRFSAPPG